MTDRIRLHLDENVDPDIARALRRHGIDVRTTEEAGLRTQSDIVQLDFIRREVRVITTHDADFLHIASTTDDHPGIVYCDKTARSVGEIIRGLILIYEVLTRSCNGIRTSVVYPR
jgi:predicted nuclease of predicted toxin-antitoxin system